MPSPSPTSNPAQPIQHIVLMIQENRTPDQLFQAFPGANTQAYGYEHTGKKVMLRKVPLLEVSTPGNYTSTSKTIVTAEPAFRAKTAR